MDILTHGTTIQGFLTHGTTIQEVLKHGATIQEVLTHGTTLLNREISGDGSACRPPHVLQTVLMSCL